VGPGRKPPVANLLPDELRPRPFPWPLAATAALALLALGIGAAIPTVTFVKERHALAALDARIARLAPKVERAERLAAEVERARRELATLRSFDEQGLHPLPVLRELTDTLPGDAWLTNLSVDRSGLELAGFANAASQLIPLLEASPALERVEFTSPVTKGRDREQFRLRASWERRGGGR
jgi:Tfp pilus assembly protein PilN